MGAPMPLPAFETIPPSFGECGRGSETLFQTSACQSQPRPNSMAAMTNPSPKPAFAAENEPVARSLQRLQFELALDLSIPAGPVEQIVSQAAESAGVELLLALPAVQGKAATAVVRLSEDGRDSFLQVRTADGGFVVCDEAEMDQLLLRLARAQVDVLRRLAKDMAARKHIEAA